MALEFFKKGWSRAHLGNMRDTFPPSRYFIDFEHRGNSRLYFATEEDRATFNRECCVIRDWKGKGVRVLDYYTDSLGLWLGYPPTAVCSFVEGSQDVSVSLGSLLFTCSHKVLTEVMDELWMMYAGCKGIRVLRIQVTAMGAGKRANRPSVSGRFTGEGLTLFVGIELPYFLEHLFTHPATPRDRNPSLYPPQESPV